MWCGDIVWTPLAPLHVLAAKLIADADADAAAALANRLLGARIPPPDFTAFVALIPGLESRLTRPIFDVLCDAYDREHERLVLAELEKNLAEPEKEAA